MKKLLLTICLCYSLSTPGFAQSGALKWVFEGMRGSVAYLQFTQNSGEAMFTQERVMKRLSTESGALQKSYVLSEQGRNPMPCPDGKHSVDYVSISYPDGSYHYTARIHNHEKGTSLILRDTSHCPWVLNTAVPFFFSSDGNYLLLSEYDDCTHTKYRYTIIDIESGRLMSQIRDSSLAPTYSVVGLSFAEKEQYFVLAYYLSTGYPERDSLRLKIYNLEFHTQQTIALPHTCTHYLYRNSTIQQGVYSYCLSSASQDRIILGRLSLADGHKRSADTIFAYAFRNTSFIGTRIKLLNSTVNSPQLFACIEYRDSVNASLTYSDTAITVFDAYRATIIRRIPLPLPPSSATASYSGDSILCMTAQGMYLLTNSNSTWLRRIYPQSHFFMNPASCKVQFIQSQDKKMLVSVVENQLIRWDYQQNKLDYIQSTPYPIESISYDGTMLLDNYYLYDCNDSGIASGRLFRHDGSTCFFHPTLQSVFSTSMNQSHISEYDVKSGNVRRRCVSSMPTYGVATINPSGTLIAASSYVGTIIIFNHETSNEQFLLTGHSSPPYLLGFSADGSLLASYADDETIRIWDVQTQRQVVRIQAKNIRALVFSKNNNYLFTCGTDSTLRIWNSQTGALLTTWRDYPAPLTSLDISSDGLYLAAATKHATILIWETQKLGAFNPVSVTSHEELNDFSVYPNPCSNQDLRLHLPDMLSGVSQLLVYNALGQCLWVQTVDATSTPIIGTENLPAGSYTLALIKGAMQWHTSVVVVH